MHVMITVPFRALFTGVISSVDVNGLAPLSDVLEVDTLEEFTTALWIATVNSQTHCMSLSDYLQYDIQKLLGMETVLQHLQISTLYIVILSDSNFYMLVIPLQ